MAARKKLKRVAASQPGFLTLKSSSDPTDLIGSRRKRVNKNKKKNWNKYSDINDIEEFLEDIRHQERTTGWGWKKKLALKFLFNSLSLAFIYLFFYVILCVRVVLLYTRLSEIFTSQPAAC